MSVSQLEIKQSVEDSVTDYEFNLVICPPKFNEAFRKALRSEEGILDLQDQEVADEDVLAYIVPFLDAHPRITTLNISYNSIHLKGAEALARNKTLRTLDIGHNYVEVEGAQALAGNTTLRTLKIWHNYIRDTGAKALARNSTLTTLDISWNKISAQSAGALERNTTLRTLNISSNDIDDMGVVALARNTTLTTLDINCNYIYAAGARALAGNTTLRTLGISGNYIDAECVEDLANNTTLTTLNISNNNIDDASAMVLANNRTLSTLDVRRNNISLPGAQALIQCQKYRIEEHNEKKLAFLMGTREKSKSFVQILKGHVLADKNMLGAILGYIEPKLLDLIHNFSPEIMSALSSCEHNTPSAPLSPSTAYHDVEAVTFAFRTALPCYTPYFNGIADDNEVKVSSEAHEVETKTQQEYNEMNAYILDPTNADDTDVSFVVQSVDERTPSSSTEASTSGVPAVYAADTAELRRQTVRNAWAKRFPSSKQ